MTGPRTFALARYTPLGALDSSFDGDGMATTDLLGYGSFALAVAVDANGIVAAGGALAAWMRPLAPTAK